MIVTNVTVDGVLTVLACAAAGKMLLDMLWAAPSKDAAHSHETFSADDAANAQAREALNVQDTAHVAPEDLHEVLAEELQRMPSAEKIVPKKQAAPAVIVDGEHTAAEPVVVAIATALAADDKGSEVTRMATRAAYVDQELPDYLKDAGQLASSTESATAPAIRPSTVETDKDDSAGSWNNVNPQDFASILAEDRAFSTV